MKATQLARIIGMGLALAAGTASAELRWENGLLGQFTAVDADRTGTDNSFGFGFDTVVLTDDYNGVSAHFNFTDLETDVPGFSADRWAGTLGYWRYLTPDDAGIVRPYGNVGIGYTVQNSTLAGVEDKAEGYVIDAAIGVVTNGYLLTPGLRARGEVRGNFDDVEDELIEYKVGIGLQYVWGARPAPAPVAAAPVTKPLPPARTVKPAPAPAPAAAPAWESRKVESRTNVYFKTGSAELSADGKKSLKMAADKVKASAKSRKALEAGIVGYADSRGTPERNKVLSEKRAQAVADFLRAEGLTSDQVEIFGAGVSSDGDNSTKEGRAMNRRVEVRLVHDED